MVLAMTTVCGAADVMLVEDGRAVATIVVAPGASPSEQFAARELRDHIRQMSGAELTIETRPLDAAAAAAGGLDAMPAPAVLIGFAPEQVGIGGAGDLGTDGFAVRTTDDGRLLICGGAKRGTLYGVYDVLEDLGVRWWYPGETTLPKTSTVTVAHTDRVERPALEYRDMMFNENYSHQRWNARNKLNGMAWDEAPERLGGRYRFVGNLVHSYVHLLRDSGHEITEEMKALVDGKRTLAQPCLSDDGTVDAMVDAVLKTFEETPDARFVVVGQMDNRSYCRCEDCAAIDAQEGSHAGQVIRFANRVAERVAERRPGSALCTAAYGWSRTPPKTLKPRENVYITLCPIECDFAHPLTDARIDENRAFVEDMTRWGRIAPKLFIWTYIGNRDHYLMPNAELKTLVPNTRFFAAHGAAGVFNQGTHHGRATDMTMLKQWVLAKAMWNPQLDGDALIAEFCHGFYGAAGEDVLRYIDLIHAPAETTVFHNGRRNHLNTPYLRPEIVAEAEAILRGAAAKVEPGSDEARRLRHVRMGIWYVLAKRGPGSRTWELTEKAVGGPLDPSAIADNLARVVDEWDVNAIIDNYPVDPWIDWVRHYMDLVEQTGGAPVPSDLADVDPTGVRLVQANQFDMTPKWWAPSDGASDGYAAHVPGPGWHTKYALNPWEDVTAGRRYKLYVRARADLKAGAAGDVWAFGVYPHGETVRVTAEQIGDGQWKVFELGPWTAREGQYWWTALRRNPNGADSVAVDCLWIRPVR
ncbi:MAG: DUF4838 domain-containing protein [Planctomycetota bacterium]